MEEELYGGDRKGAIRGFKIYELKDEWGAMDEWALKGMAVVYQEL